MGNNITFPKITALKVLWKQENEAHATNYIHDFLNCIVYNTPGKDYHWESAGLCIVDML